MDDLPSYVNTLTGRVSMALLLAIVLVRIPPSFLGGLNCDQKWERHELS